MSHVMGLSVCICMYMTAHKQLRALGARLHLPSIHTLVIWDYEIVFGVCIFVYSTVEYWDLSTYIMLSE